MTQSVRIGLAQISGEAFDVTGNRKIADEAISRAFDQAADIVVLPEMIVHGYVADWRALAPIAEPVPGPTVEAWTELAAAATARASWSSDRSTGPPASRRRH